MQEAYWQLRLDRVMLMPVGDAPHKQIQRDPGREERYELCRLAAEGSDWLDVSRLEVDRPGLSYTEDTLRGTEIAGPEDEVFLLMGADQAASLPEWREPENVLARATVAVARRSGVGEAEVRKALEGLRGAERLKFFDMPVIDVSSSEIRRRVASGRPYRYFLSERVAARIEERGLYREESVEESA